MANNENLVSGRFSDMPSEELREIGRRGGIKSGESRNAAKKIKDNINDLLKMKIDCKELPFFATLMVWQTKVTISEALAMALIYITVLAHHIVSLRVM